MSLQQQIMEAMKTAMKSKDTVALTALRSVKSAILLAQTESGSKDSMSESEEVKLLQKLVKQRQEYFIRKNPSENAWTYVFYIKVKPSLYCRQNRVYDNDCMGVKEGTCNVDLPGFSEFGGTVHWI